MAARRSVPLSVEGTMRTSIPSVKVRPLMEHFFLKNLILSADFIMIVNKENGNGRFIAMTKDRFGGEPAPVVAS